MSLTGFWRRFSSIIEAVMETIGILCLCINYHLCSIFYIIPHFVNKCNWFTYIFVVFSIVLNPVELRLFTICSIRHAVYNSFMKILRVYVDVLKIIKLCCTKLHDLSKTYFIGQSERIRIMQQRKVQKRTAPI